MFANLDDTSKDTFARWAAEDVTRAPAVNKIMTGANKIDMKSRLYGTAIYDGAIFARMNGPDSTLLANRYELPAFSNVIDNRVRYGVDFTDTDYDFRYNAVGSGSLMWVLLRQIRQLRNQLRKDTGRQLALLIKNSERKGKAGHNSHPLAGLC